MIGASRESLATVRARLDELADAPGFTDLPDELRAVATLLGRETQLRNTLSDGGSPLAVRTGIVSRLLSGKVSDLAVGLVVDVVSQRWSSARDMVDAVELLGSEAAFVTAEREGRLDTVENELFAFGRAYDASPDLQLTLSDPAVPAERKVAVVQQLLAGRAEPETLDAVRHVVADPRGRKVEAAVEELVSLAAIRRERLVAVATVARPLDDDQRTRLTAALARIYAQNVDLHVVLDPAVVGGVRIDVGDEVIDGTIAHRLEQVRRLVG
ncbi:MAG: F0F1 ATP synthase subunit delta [Actinomycetia bacterium]|jgi:F-type H+-transporting ATPase subunit delta|nr:F0F1 ATP synthase subunit delta [Actinomycetes bacterium]